MYPSDQQLTLCPLNARSLNNKSAAFLELVCDVRADLFIICETWLKDHHSTVLSKLTPPGYRTLIHCPRPGRRGGGTALLVKEGINVSSVYSDEKTSFEVSEWLVSFGPTRVRTVIVYRPPYSDDHPISAGVFFHEFAEYLESVVLPSDKLLIIGDLNFHMDVPTDPNNIHFRDLLDAMGLVQHVKHPTHIDPPDDLDKLVNCYNTTLPSLLNKHAPMQSRKIRNKSRPPWFNDVVMQARRDRRKAEKRWRRTGLASDLLAIKSKRNYVIYIMNNARRTYYSQFIEENSSNQSKLFLPPDTDAVKLANDMGDYFVRKIQADGQHSGLSQCCPRI